MKQLDGTGMKRLHREWRRRTEGRLALVLEDVEGPFNVGAIVRTAAALRADDVWLVGRTPDPREAKVQKTALGTDRYLAFHRCSDGSAAVAEARVAGYEVLALELADDASPLHERVLTGATAVVVGHEDRGVSAATLAACDAVTYLPLLGKVGSLNAATAASIACYEVRRQTWAADAGSDGNVGSQGQAPP